MKSPAALAVVLLLAVLPAAQAQMGPYAKAIEKARGAAATASTGLGQTQAVQGIQQFLKTALADAAKSATPQTIDIPSELTALAAAQTATGTDSPLAKLTTALQRALNGALPKSPELLQPALAKFTVPDADALLSGGSSGITDAFRSASEASLKEKLSPLIDRAFLAYGVDEYLQKLTAAPAAGAQPADAVAIKSSLRDQVLGKTIDALYGFIAGQEAAYRADPSKAKDPAVQQLFSAGQ